MAKRGRHKVRICLHGHDTFICGRDDRNRCIECRSHPLPIKQVIKPICSKGHDKSIVGVYKDGKCKVCVNERAKKRHAKVAPLLKEKRRKFRLEHPLEKQFCPKNHDTFICGRYKGMCNNCILEKNRIDPTKDSRIKEVCINGHELVKVGRYKNGKCRACTNKRSKEYNEKHLVENALRQKKYYLEHQEEIKLRHKEWVRDNPDIIKASRIKSVTNRNLRIPSWADWNRIVEVYKNCPENMEVDHYIPVQGRKVSGLHVSWNLQYLSKSKNSSKGNRCNLLEASEWYGRLLEKEGLK
jgi:hypothetical protein